ncbi:CAP domain-containing protein [Paenibacillus sanguinis]|uniref:CAP domain-containing protein n=1 Tax=Paenibacillus sanguinis TaxID=225906 RepID=UPI00036ADB96|nr:CAP domain-containing protein [Paenibacillus sanguinis]
MKPWGKKIGLAGLLLSVLVGSTMATGEGWRTGTAHAAAAQTKKEANTSKALAIAYARIQTQNASKVVALINKERRTVGLQPLMVHTNLTNMAKIKAIDMYNNRYFNHISPKYGSPFEMMDAFGISYKYAGENLGKGQRSAEEVVKDWMNSPGHQKNILNPDFKLIGVGYYNGHWAQEFIGK